MLCAKYNLQSERTLKHPVLLIFELKLKAHNIFSMKENIFSQLYSQTCFIHCLLTKLLLIRSIRIWHLCLRPWPVLFICNFRCLYFFIQKTKRMAIKIGQNFLRIDRTKRNTGDFGISNFFSLNFPWEHAPGSRR